MGKTQKILGAALILLALVLGGYAWVLSEQMTAKRQEAQPQMQPVVVAAVRIPAGSAITPEMVRVAMFPTRPDGAYPDVKAVAGKSTASDIAAGEPLIQERLEGGQRAMLQQLEPGERAVAVRVDDVIAVGNRLNPGDWVDVYVTLRRNNDEVADTQSRRLLEKLKVLAFGAKEVGAAKNSGDGSAAGQRNNTNEIPKTAVLAVKLEDIDKLALAAESGRLLLALRPNEQKPEAGSEQGAAPMLVANAANATAKTPQQTITLKELIGNQRRTEGGANAGIAARGASRPASGASPGKAVTVMHGLKEKTVYLSANKIEARR